MRMGEKSGRVATLNLWFFCDHF